MVSFHRCIFPLCYQFQQTYFLGSKIYLDFWLNFGSLHCFCLCSCWIIFITLFLIEMMRGSNFQSFFFSRFGKAWSIMNWGERSSLGGVITIYFALFDLFWSLVDEPVISVIFPQGIYFGWRFWIMCSYLCTSMDVGSNFFFLFLVLFLSAPETLDNHLVIVRIVSVIIWLIADIFSSCFVPPWHKCSPSGRTPEFFLTSKKCYFSLV